MEEWPPIPVIRKTGDEPFHHAGGKPLGVRLRDFWSWADSDLLGNTVRGRLAEYLVARALEVDNDVRRDWMPFDLQTPNGLAVEVKSASYNQTWAQRRYSRIVYDIGPTLGWDQDRAEFGKTRRRHAHVYVFALLGKHERETVNPLDLDQWSFYVLATSALDNDAKLRTQKTLSLERLEKVAPPPVEFCELGRTIRSAHAGSPSDRGLS